MRVSFTKAEASGNDMILVDARALEMLRCEEAATAMCRRHFGIGGDGLMLVDHAVDGAPDVRMFNPDGSEDFCGNGLRCVAAWLLGAGEAARDSVRMRTPWGSHRARALARRGREFTIETEILAPTFSPPELPARVRAPRILRMPFDVAGRRLEISSAAVGSLHTVIFGEEDVDEETFQTCSPLIEHHEVFPERTSVLWCRVEGRDRLRMRIWERAVGETTSCGTGACAAVAVGRCLGLLDDRVHVVSAGGTARVAWSGSGPIRLTGPARLVYTGTYEFRTFPDGGDCDG
jgi:diaminopimelate epimerase